MGAVYEAVDDRTGMRVAVKLLHAGVVGSTTDDAASRIERFQREAKVAASIDSKHVAKVIDWGTDNNDGGPFMVMELLEGEDLQRVFKRIDVLPPEVALRIAAQACEGLVKAHAAHILHRDIKPANLILARQAHGELTVKILDFGIAKIKPEMERGSETNGLTRTGAMLGSPLYMSPEQARGSKKLDYRTDLWSLGVVLYRALTGHLPHEQAEALGDFIVVLCSEPPPPVQAVAPWVPPEIAAVVDRALQINRDRRFASAEEMLAAIKALLPNGDAIRPEMIAPLDPTSRAVVAPKLSIPPPSPMADTTGDTSGPRPAPEGLSTVSGAVHASSVNTMPGKKSGVSKIALAGAAVIAVGLGVFGVLRTIAPSAQGTDASNTSAPIAKPAENERKVTVVILPADASVEVAGKPVTVTDGVIELRGALGSLHRVVLTKGAQKAKVEVVIAEAGAMPPKVELPAIPEDKPAASAKPVAPSHGPGPAKQAPTSKPSVTPRKDPLIPERFE